MSHSTTRIELQNQLVCPQKTTIRATTGFGGVSFLDCLEIVLRGSGEEKKSQRVQGTVDG